MAYRDPMQSLIHPYRLPCLLGLLGTILIWICTSRYGAGLSDDSISYISAANHLMSGRGYSNFHGEEIFVFPPLFSTVLALFGGGHADLFTAARYVNAVLFGLGAGLSANWLVVHCQSFWLSLIGAAAIILSAPLIEVFAFAWSEPLFIVLGLSALFQMEKFLRSENYLPIVLASLYTALACLTRYVGVTLILTGLGLLVLDPKIASLGKVKRLATFSTSVLPISLWLVRNFLHSGTLTGYRPQAKATIANNVHLAADTIINWVLPGSLPILLRAALILCYCGLAAAPAVLAIRKRREDTRAVAHWQIIPMVLFVAVYVGFLLLAATTAALDPIEDRYLSALYWPLVLISIFLLDRARLFYARFFTGKLVDKALLLSLALWLSYPAKNAVEFSVGCLRFGAGGFHTVRWVDSELIGYLNEHELQDPVYSNESSAVYALTGQAVRRSPRKHHYESLAPTDDLAQFEKTLQIDGQAYLVMFAGDWGDFLYDAEFFKSKYQVDEVVPKADGAIYRVRLKER